MGASRARNLFHKVKIFAIEITVLRVLPARLHDLTRLDLLPSVFALNRARRIDGGQPSSGFFP